MVSHYCTYCPFVAMQARGDPPFLLSFFCGGIYLPGDSAKRYCTWEMIWALIGRRDSTVLSMSLGQGTKPRIFSYNHTTTCLSCPGAQFLSPWSHHLHPPPSPSNVAPRCAHDRVAPLGLCCCVGCDSVRGLHRLRTVVLGMKHHNWCLFV